MFMTRIQKEEERRHVWYGIVGFHIPHDTLYIIFRIILHVN